MTSPPKRRTASAILDRRWRRSPGRAASPSWPPRRRAGSGVGPCRIEGVCRAVGLKRNGPGSPRRFPCFRADRGRVSSDTRGAPNESASAGSPDEAVHYSRPAPTQTGLLGKAAGRGHDGHAGSALGSGCSVAASPQRILRRRAREARSSSTGPIAAGCKPQESRRSERGWRSGERGTNPLGRTLRPLDSDPTGFSAFGSSARRPRYGHDSRFVPCTRAVRPDHHFLAPLIDGD